MEQLKINKAIVVIQDIITVIKNEGIVYLYQNALNTQVLANLGMNVQVQKEIIDSLGLEDFKRDGKEYFAHQWRIIAQFGKMHRGRHLDIFIGLGMPHTPAACLRFTVRPPT